MDIGDQIGSWVAKLGGLLVVGGVAAARVAARAGDEVVQTTVKLSDETGVRINSSLELTTRIVDSKVDDVRAGIQERVDDPTVLIEDAAGPIFDAATSVQPPSDSSEAAQDWAGGQSNSLPVDVSGLLVLAVVAVVFGRWMTAKWPPRGRV